LTEIDIIPAADLPDTGDTGAHGKTPAMTGQILFCRRQRAEFEHRVDAKRK
jgi:hypothetical protein